MHNETPHTEWLTESHTEKTGKLKKLFGETSTPLSVKNKEHKNYTKRIQFGKYIS